MKSWLDPFVCDVEVLVHCFHVLLELECFVLLGLPFRNVLDQESVCVVPGQEDLSDYCLDPDLGEVEVVSPDEWRVDQVQSDCISSELVADEDWVRVVLESFGHLLPVCREDKPVDDQVFVRVHVLDACWDDIQSVKPAPGLIDALSDEVSREYLLELFLGSAEWVMYLGIRHGATFEPAVKDLVYSSELAFALFWFNCQVVDVLSVQVGDLVACEFLELADWTHTDNLQAIVRDPERDWVSPVPVSREAPVLSVLEPVVEPLLLDGLGHPRGLVIVLHQVLLEIGHPDKPSRHCLVDQGGVAPPTEGVVVHLWVALDHSSLILDVLDDYLICIFHIDSFVYWALFCEFAVLVNWHWWVVWVDYSFWDAHFVIFLPESWCTVDNACACVVSNEVGNLDFEAAILFSACKEVEHRHVLLAFQVFAFVLFDDFESLFVLSVESLKPALSHDEDFIPLNILELDIIHFPFDCKCQVRRQCPWSRGPYHKFYILVLNKREADIKWRVADFFIVELDLEVRQDSGASIWIWHDLSSSVNNSFLEKLLEDVPNWLHELDVQCFVVVLEVNPSAESFNHALPFVRVFHHDISAMLVVLSNTHL